MSNITENRSDRRIVICPSHLDLDLYLGKVFVKFNWEVLYLSDGLQFNLNEKDLNILHNQVGCKKITYKEFLSLGSGTLAIICSCEEHEAEVYEKLVNKRPDAFVVHVMGNNITEGKWGSRWKTKWGRVIKNPVKNFIALDIQGFDYYQARAVPNICYIQPAIHPNYKFAPLPEGKPRVSCFIRQYSQYKYYKREFAIYERVTNAISDIADIKLFGEGNPDGFLISEERVDQSTEKVDKRLRDEIWNSWLVLHLRRYEGYGFSVVKSLSCGRPIVSLKELVMDKTMQYFCVDGISSILERDDRIDDLISRMRYYLLDRAKMEELILTTKRHVDHILCEEEQLRRLSIFLGNLKK